MKIISSYLITISLQAFVESATVLNFVSKQCDKKDTFLNLFGGSLQKCTEECDRRSRCRSIMFMQGMKHCSLKDNAVGSAIDLNGTQCMFLEKRDWISSDLGPCNETQCNVTETCVSMQDRSKFLCLKSACPSPPVIGNASLLSDIQTIGSTNVYMCNYGFRRFGSPRITCNNNAEWERSKNFRCEPRCKEPKPSYSNAVLSRKEYVGQYLFQREVIHFTCGKDFQALGTTASSTCNKHGNWHYNRVRCCHNGTYDIAWHQRCVFYTGQLESYGQFTAICSGRGYKKTGYHSALMKYMLVNHQVINVLMPERKSSYYKNNRYSIEKCFESKNITMDNSTFDTKIEFARENNMTQDACRQVSWWAPSEPNGGAGENCIMRKANERGYLLYDLPCDNLIDFKIGAFCHSDMPII